MGTDGDAKQYIDILQDYNQSMIVGLRESLHTIVNDIILTIKMTNTDQAAKKSDFLVKHIFEGLMIDTLELDDFDEMFDFGGMETSFLGGESFSKNMFRSSVAQIMVINSHEVIITLPIPVSAQDPMSFDIRKAIMETRIFQEIMKW